jgi:hypothetical protein
MCGFTVIAGYQPQRSVRERRDFHIMNAISSTRNKRVIVIANKNWEMAPLMNVLLEPRACPAGLAWPTTLNPLTQWQAGSRSKTVADISNPMPRAVFTITEKLNNTTSGENEIIDHVTSIEVWCLQDWMAPPPASSSSTFEKIKALPKIFGWSNDDSRTVKDPDFVIAFGTAGFPTAFSSYNGCVVVGANVFIYNPFRNTPNPNSSWDDSGVARPIAATLPKEFFAPASATIDDVFRSQVESRFIVPPMCPADTEILIAAYNYTAVGAVNVTDYDDYAWADPKALDEFKAHDNKNPAGSIETTHGIIRIQSQAPFLFVSGITDREGLFSSFNMEVSTRVYSQNFASAHNAGVVAAWLLPRVAHFLITR